MARVAGESPNVSVSNEDNATITRRTVDTLPGRRRYRRNSGSRPPRDKNRLRRERQSKVFKISVNKINRIDDTNICMRRFVLIKNTGNRLQAEIGNDRIARFASDALSSSAGVTNTFLDSKIFATPSSGNITPS